MEFYRQVTMGLLSLRNTEKKKTILESVLIKISSAGLRTIKHLHYICLHTSGNKFKAKSKIKIFEKKKRICKFIETLIYLFMRSL